MWRAWFGRLALGVFCLGGLTPGLRAGEPEAKSASRDPVKDARALAARIDKHIAAKWQAHKVKPAPLSSDAEFFRRVNLDLVGRIPALTDVRDFLDDDEYATPEDKRRAWVEELLKKKVMLNNQETLLYAQHFANVWRHIMLPNVNNNEFIRYYGTSLEGWLRERLRDNTGYDKMARELLTAPVYGQSNTSPGIFYQANELKAENLAASTSRLFLGHKLECAQCHDHPFAKWTREQFWEYAAFFSGISPQRGELPNSREIKIAGTDKTVKARFLDGTAPKWSDGKSTRATLADWLTRPDNPYFARATVNKVWAYFFGIGLVEPMDEETDDNPASHPELLDELAREFAAHDFDLKFLIRAIVGSRTYQLSSTGDDPSQKNPRLFARMQVRGLSPEQLFDSLIVATGLEDKPLGPRNFNFQNTPRTEFLTKFGNQDKRVDTEVSILQALFMMNGKFMAEAASLKHNRQLRHIAEGSEGVPLEKRLEQLYEKVLARRPTVGELAGATRLLKKSKLLESAFVRLTNISVRLRVEQMYLITLARKPTARESARMVKYINKGGKRGDQKKAFEDVFWALLNSGEFMLNH
jgi:hypothetical protein